MTDSWYIPEPPDLCWSIEQPSLAFLRTVDKSVTERVENNFLYVEMPPPVEMNTIEMEMKERS